MPCSGSRATSSPAVRSAQSLTSSVVAGSSGVERRRTGVVVGGDDERRVGRAGEVHASSRGMPHASRTELFRAATIDARPRRFSEPGARNTRAPRSSDSREHVDPRCRRSGRRRRPSSVDGHRPASPAGRRGSPTPSLSQPASSTSAPGRSASAKHAARRCRRTQRPVCPLPSTPPGKNAYGGAVEAERRAAGRTPTASWPRWRSRWRLSVDVDSVRQAPPSPSKFVVRRLEASHRSRGRFPPRSSTSWSRVTVVDGSGRPWRRHRRRSSVPARWSCRRGRPPAGPDGSSR